jgi:hypothetical protein
MAVRRMPTTQKSWHGHLARVRAAKRLLHKNAQKIHEIVLEIIRKIHLQNKHEQDARATGYDGFLCCGHPAHGHFSPFFSPCSQRQFCGLIACIRVNRKSQFATRNSKVSYEKVQHYSAKPGWERIINFKQRFHTEFM